MSDMAEPKRHRHRIRIQNVGIDVHDDGSFTVYRWTELGRAIEVPANEIDDLMVALDAARGFQHGIVVPVPVVKH